MSDPHLSGYLHRIRDRHGPDSDLARTISGMSYLVERATEIHRNQGPQAAQAVIRNELMLQFLDQFGVVESRVRATTDPRIRDDWTGIYGPAFVYKDNLSRLGRLAPGDWALAEVNTRSIPR